MLTDSLYKKLIEICARDFIINRLSEKKFNIFVDKIYNDLKEWSNPHDIPEADIIDRIGEHVSYTVSRSMDDIHIGTNHD
tara:strand:+ start:53 stop:292 length:240 start_codon:yes stop_codon:yes gene_type:complete